MGWGEGLSGAGSGAMAGASLGPWGAVAGGAIGLIGGLMGNSANSNPNDWMKDPNSPMYKNAVHQYYQNMLRTLNAGTPQTQGLLALAQAHGGDYGGSNYIATKQREQIVGKNTDNAGAGAEQFGSQLYQQGMGMYSQGALQSQQMKGGFGNELMRMGGGLLGDYFGTQGGQGSSQGLGQGGLMGKINIPSQYQQASTPPWGNYGFGGN